MTLKLSAEPASIFFFIPLASRTDSNNKKRPLKGEMKAHRNDSTLINNNRNVAAACSDQ